MLLISAGSRYDGKTGKMIESFQGGRERGLGEWGEKGKISLGVGKWRHFYAVVTVNEKSFLK